jgi:hypothetical protein
MVDAGPGHVVLLPAATPHRTLRLVTDVVPNRRSMRVGKPSTGRCPFSV